MVFMGSAFPARCKMCGEKVGIPYSSWKHWKFVFALTMVALVLVRSFASLVIVLVAGFMLGSYLQLRRIPLVPSSQAKVGGGEPDRTALHTRGRPFICPREQLPDKRDQFAREGSSRENGRMLWQGLDWAPNWRKT